MRWFSIVQTKEEQQIAEGTLQAARLHWLITDEARANRKRHHLPTMHETNLRKILWSLSDFPNLNWGLPVTYQYECLYVPKCTYMCKRGAIWAEPLLTVTWSWGLAKKITEKPGKKQNMLSLSPSYWRAVCCHFRLSSPLLVYYIAFLLAFQWLYKHWFHHLSAKK